MEVKRFYDEFEGHDITPRTHKKIDLRMRQALSLAKEGIVLDVGCRDGKLKNFISSSEYVGLDITSKFFKKGPIFLVAEAKSLPFRDRIIDVVFAMEVIEHLLNHRNFIKETSRILRDDGDFILSTPNIVCLLNRFKILVGKAPSWFGFDDGHLHCFTFKTIKETLSPYFKVIDRKTVYTSLPLRSIIKTPLTIQKFLAKLAPNLSDIILVKANKMESLED